MADLIRVMALVRLRNIQPGETIGLSAAVAAKAVAAGEVRYVDEPPPESRVPAAPPVDKAVKAPPKAKGKAKAKKKAAKKPKK